MDWGAVWLELWRKHRGKILGVFLGLVFGIFVVSFGFWKAVFIALCVVVGFFIGKKIDQKVNFKEVLHNFVNQ